MAWLQSSVRFALLDALGSAKTMGLPPWILLTAWMVFVTQQEPTLLRNHSILLVGDGAIAAWSALLILALNSRGHLSQAASPLAEALSSLLLLTSAAIGLILTMIVCDGARGLTCNWTGFSGSTLSFLVAWCPLVVALSRQSRPAQQALAACWFCFGVTCVAQHASGLSIHLHLAALAALVASILLSR